MSREAADTRQKILQSAWELLIGAQSSAVRMGDIAKRTGISRQAVYLHFPTRVELLIATTRYIDEVKEIDARLAKSRGAVSGLDRLEAYVEAWGNYIPEIYGLARALMALQAKDEAARAAWSDRMGAVRHGCEAVVRALDNDNRLSKSFTIESATDFLWAQLSVEVWEHLCIRSAWPQAKYVEVMQKTLRAALID